MKKLLLGTALSMCLFPSISMANPLTVENVTLPYYETLNLYGSVDGNTINETVLAGQIVLTFTNSLVDGVWCDDLFHQIYLGSSGEQYSQGPLVTDNSNNPSNLSQTQIQLMESLAAYGNNLMAVNPFDENSAIVQMAIWYVEYNNSAGNYLTFTGGTFNVSEVTDLIGDIGNSINHGDLINQLDALNGTQDEIDPKSIPEPGTITILGIGLLGLGALRRLTPSPF